MHKKRFIYTLFYSLCLGALGCVAFFLIQWITLGGVDRRLLLPSVLWLFAVVLLVRPLDRFLTKLTSRIFFREKRRYHQALRAASAGMGRIRNLPRLLKLIVRVIVSRVRVVHATIFLKDREKPAFVAVASRGHLKEQGRSFHLAQTSPLVTRLEQHQEVLVRKDVEAQIKVGRQDEQESRILKKVVEEMERLQAAVCVPSFMDGKLKGFLMLGEKRSGEGYDQEDLSIFSALAAQAALAIENAQAYEELRDTRDQLLQSERLNTIGKFAADMAHEIKNPLQAIVTYFELLPEKHDDPEFRERFAKLAKAEAGRINELVRELATYTNPKPPKFRRFDLPHVIDNVLALLEHDLQRRQIRVSRGYSPNPMDVEADPDQMKQVFLNLFMNAVDAMPSENGRDNHLEVVAFPDGKTLVIKIRDTGCGMSEKQLSALFTPFFTTKEKGIGLGLSIVQNILRAHDATIVVESQVGQGTAFAITMPRRQPGAGLSEFTQGRLEDAYRARGG